MIKFIVFLLMMLAILPVEAQDTVKLKNLKNINGLFYEEKTGSPYTGYAATYHSNGAVASLYNIFNGVKSGKVQIFFDSGKKRIITY
jgi:antitoxin component YwqK of YwqJK toxin-antitoxin module